MGDSLPGGHRDSLLHCQFFEKKCKAVGVLVDYFGYRLAAAVPRTRLDANEDWRGACLRGLQCGGVLEAVPRHDAIIVVGGGDQDRWVVSAGLDVVERGVG